MKIDAALFRRVLGAYPTGVTIVTAKGSPPAGMAVNSFTSVSLAPPLVSFCAATSSSTWPLIESSGHFVVNVLAEGQEATCRRFAAKGVERFEGVGSSPGVTGAPVLDDALAWIECEIDAEHPAGDHVIVVGRVVSVGARDGDPLVFFRGRYGGFRDQEATSAFGDTEGAESMA